MEIDGIKTKQVLMRRVEFQVLALVSFQETSTTIAIGQNHDGSVLYTTDCPAGEFISSKKDVCLVNCLDGEFVSSNNRSCIQLP